MAYGYEQQSKNKIWVFLQREEERKKKQKKKGEERLPSWSIDSWLPLIMFYFVSLGGILVSQL